MNLLQKLNEKLKSMTKDSKLVKKLASISMAGVMMATLAGCTTPNTQDKGNENEQHNEQTIDDEKDEKNEKQEKINKRLLECYKDNSQILKDIVTSEYYYDLLVKADYKQMNYKTDNHFKPIPLQFLLDNGYSSTDIANATFLDPQFYVINNKLYSFIIFQRQGKDYYDEFFLSCDASELEINDFIKLRDLDVIESSFFIQELSKKYDFNLIYSGHFASNKYKKITESAYKDWAHYVVDDAKTILGIKSNDTKCNLIPLYTEPNPNPNSLSDFLYCFVMPIMDNNTNLGILKYDYVMNLDYDNNQTIYKGLSGYSDYKQDSIIKAKGITFKQANLKYALPLGEYQTLLDIDSDTYSKTDMKVNI